MLLIGIAGKTGSGKNYVAGLLEKRGFRSKDLDHVAHRSLEALADTIEQALGPGLLLNGKIDRNELGRRVFSSQEKIRILEDITYPWIEAETKKWILENPETSAVIHAVNLHRISLMNDCNAIIWLKCSVCLRRKRVILRDKKPWKDLKERFRSQNGLKPKLFPRNAEIYSVKNSGNDASLNLSLDRILHHLEGFGGQHEC